MALLIPEQLKNEHFRFTKLNGKIPIEKDWQKENNYKFNDEKLLSHHNNIGVICGRGNLIVVDIDGNGEETLKKVLELLPATYVVKTGKQGYHVFYTSDELISGTCFDFNDSHIDIKADRGQVVMQGSTHPETKKLYLCELDLPISPIKKSDFEKAFALKQNKGTTVKDKTIHLDNDKSRSATEMSHVMRLLYKGKTKAEVFAQMSAFDKWKHAPESYQEFTYNKALGMVKESKIEPITSENIKYKVLDLLCDMNKDSRSSSLLEAEVLLVRYFIFK